MFFKELTRKSSWAETLFLLEGLRSFSLHICEFLDAQIRLSPNVKGAQINVLLELREHHLIPLLQWP